MEALKALQQRGFLLNETSYKLTNSGKRELLEICSGKRKISNMYEKCRIEEDITPEEKRELGYQTDEDVYLDPISMLPIPKKDLIIVNDLCFDLDSLKTWVETFTNRTEKPTNPLTRDLLSVETIEKLGLDPYDFKHTYRKELPPKGVTLKDGKLHSYNDQPIKVTKENKYFIKTELKNNNFNEIDIEPNDKLWFKDGKLHRDGDKPAEIWYNDIGDIIKESYYKNGKLHRDGDKPAEIHYDKYGKKVTKQFYYKNGKLHRDNEQPAEIIDNKYGKIESWYKNGVRYLPDKQIKIILTEDNIDFIIKESKTSLDNILPFENTIDSGTVLWFKDRKLHRDNDQPAVIDYYDRDCKYILTKIWYKNGEKHRDNEQPAEIIYDDIRNEIQVKIWYKNGIQHRDNDQPAEIWYSDDGNVNEEIWYKNGIQHRDNDQPASILYYPDGKVEIESWYKNGIQHRDNDQPARIMYYRDGSVKAKKWYKNGEEYFPDN